jgi:hypothetical protein
MSRQLKKWTRIAAAAGAVALATPAAHAVQATTNVRVNFPQLLILYSFDQITLDVTQASLASKLGVTGASCTSGSYCVEFASAGPLNWDLVNNTVDANIAPVDLTGIDDLDVVVSNAWAVRSVAAGGGGLAATVSGPGTLTGPGTALPVDEVGTDRPNPVPGLGSVAPGSNRVGSINFSLDLRSLDRAGQYSGDFVIEVTSP